MALILILATFAVYRLATDLAWETGPFSAYARLRGYAQVHTAAWIAEGVTCPICLSFWIALPLLWYGPIEWLGVAGAAAFLARLTSHDD